MYTYVWMCVCTCTHVHVCTSMYVCIYTLYILCICDIRFFMYIMYIARKYVYMYVYVCIHIHIHISYLLSIKGYLFWMYVCTLHLCIAVYVGVKGCIMDSFPMRFLFYSGSISSFPTIRTSDTGTL